MTRTTMKKALIIGITGQDGSYLAELLLERGYAVHGLVRRSSTFNRTRIDHLRAQPGSLGGDRISLHYGDLNDATSVRRVLSLVRPDEIYHLAGQSHVGLSFELPEATCQENGMAAVSLLETVREIVPEARLYHASSSEVFGRAPVSPQTEGTAFLPVNPYGAAKAFATQMGQIYRESHGLFVCNGIAYNHESPRRGENFVTRKIASAAARIRAGGEEVLALGNLDAARDWGYAPEYVDAMWRILQAERADDYVLATGQLCTVREFARAAFAAVDLDLEFSGTGREETARLVGSGRVVLRVDPRYYRPVEPGRLVGDPEKVAQKLAWRAATVAGQVARIMARTEAGMLN